jgi:hypothetical protein
MKAHLWIVGLFAIAGLLVAGCATQVADRDGTVDRVIIDDRQARDNVTVNVNDDRQPSTVIVDRQPNTVIIDRQQQQPSTINIQDERQPRTVTNNYYTTTDTGTTGADGEVTQ